MKQKLPVKGADIIIILMALGLIGYSAFSVYARPRNTVRVLIQGSRQKWTFPLDAEETVSVSGPLGNTVIRIHGKQAWVESSPCENQICVAAGHIHQQGFWVACLPNNVFLMMSGSEDSVNDFDIGAW
jgi:hypothetical protein